jgi:hypothetical protein
MIKLQPKSLIKNCHLEFSDLKDVCMERSILRAK